MAKKKLRIIVGPNGSGKSSLKNSLDDFVEFHFANYLNADDILRDISASGFYLLANTESLDSFKNFANNSTYPNYIKDLFENNSIEEEDNKLFFKDDALNAYTVSLLVAYKCEMLIRSNKSFSFESVFSSKEKINLIKQAKKEGYRVYLYCISTEDAKINKGRVEIRVKDGGHDVPSEKIESRYPKSLNNIYEALSYADRAYFWDNTTVDTKFIASFNAQDLSMELSIENDFLPNWFKKYILKS